VLTGASFFAANFYHRGRGSPAGQRMNNFLPGETSHAPRSATFVHSSRQGGAVLSL
jgi:hypothetical protein